MIGREGHIISQCVWSFTQTHTHARTHARTARSSRRLNAHFDQVTDAISIFIHVYHTCMNGF